jgi:hypothetical protein
MENFVPKMAIFDNHKSVSIMSFNPKIFLFLLQSLAKSTCLFAGIHHVKSRFEWIPVMMASFLLIVQMAFLQGAMAQFIEKE